MKNGAEKTKVAEMPKLTELEQVKLENFALRHATIQQQLQANLAERASFIHSIEAAHGCRWDEKEGLIPAAEQAQETRPQ